MTLPVVWCLGMYGSASTWLFNVVRMILEDQTGAPPRVDFVSGEAPFAGASTADLVKSHEIANEAAILALARRAGVIFITVRDPRDAVTSLIQARSHTFARALHYVEQSAKLCACMRADKRARLWRYESRFFDDPATVAQLAAQLGLRLEPALSQKIFAANARAAVEAHIAAMPGRSDILRDNVSGDLLDPQTQWHSHHAGRGGEIGRWRHALSAAQVAEVQTRVPFFTAGLTT